MHLSPHSNTIATMDELSPRKNVCFAVNLEVSMVDQFLANGRSPSMIGSVSVGSLPEPTRVNKSSIGRQTSNLENHAPNIVLENGHHSNSRNNHQPNVDLDISQNHFLAPPDHASDRTRRSVREKNKREIHLAKSRVRYDMHLVPCARRNKDFLQCFQLWWMDNNKNEEKPRRSSRLSNAGMSTEEDNAFIPCCSCQTQSSSGGGVSFPTPFSDNEESVIWVPRKRSDWEDSISEMTALCASASMRRYISTRDSRSHTKPLHSPLSRDYIRDRVDIDDPLNGFQLRHKKGGWLQGFIMWTNFTTWTHYFKWDSTHDMSGLVGNQQQQDSVVLTMDGSGALADELEQQPRSGDPHGGGIVFPSIAEISLVGGLGCGEYMLRMALDSIRAANAYRFIVLQATDSSKSFYERFGFIRVGAVCRYGKQEASEGAPIQGYRHWTHANESETSLQLHGGPSYMMCLKLPTSTSCATCGRSDELRTMPSFLDQMMTLAVEQKPIIEQLGAASTPGPKMLRRTNPMNVSSDSMNQSTTSKRKHVDKPTSLRSSKSLSTAEVNANYNSGCVSPKLSPDSSPRSHGKRRRIDNIDDMACLPTSCPNASRMLTNLSVSLRTLKRDTTIPRSHTDGKVGRVNVVTNASVPNGPGRDDEPPLALLSGSLAHRSKKNPAPINKASLMKQKVKAYPRTRIHYYNRVVKPKDGPLAYFFVLQYHEDEGLIKVAPMETRGKLTGKREGRPRYQAIIGETDANFRTVNASNYEIVPAAMVMKTPVVASEAWDIEE